MMLLVGEMDIAVRIFNNMKTRDVASWTCIVKGFLDIGNLELARTYFDDMPVRDRISWAIMIDGYLLNYCSRLGKIIESPEMMNISIVCYCE